MYLTDNNAGLYILQFEGAQPLAVTLAPFLDALRAVFLTSRRCCLR